MPFDGVAQRQTVSVVGGGLSGLTSAMELVDKGYDVNVYCSENRTGGKIQSAMLGDQVVNLGAEFVDSSQTGLIELCKKLGIELTPAEDQGNIVFRTPDGRIIDEDRFFKAALPIKQKIARDKAIIKANPQGRLAQQLDTMSCEEYLAALGAETKSEPKTMGALLKNLWAVVTNPFRRSRNKRITIDDVTKTLGMAYCSEAGRSPREISALQYTTESSADLNTLLESDCGFRVKGGTERIINKLQEYITSKGGKIHLNSEVTGVNKQEDGRFALTMKDGSQTTPSDQVVLGLPSYALSKLNGLESLGFSKDDINLLQSAQYTRNSKFTVKTKAAASNDCLITSEGFQVWKSSPDTLTFLVGGDMLDRAKGGTLVRECLDKYAAAHGTTADALFDMSQVQFRGPDNKPCYASPGRGQVMQLTNLATKTAEMAKSGVGIAGTFLPFEGGVGFMECGVQSAKRNMNILTSQSVARGLAQQQNLAAATAAPTMDAPAELTNVQKYAQRSAPAGPRVR